MAIKTQDHIKAVLGKPVKHEEEETGSRQVTFRMYNSDYKKMREYFKMQGLMSDSEGIRKILLNFLKDKGVI